MRRIYLLVISMALFTLLSLAACAPGWGQPGQGGLMGSQSGMMGGQGGMMGSQSGMMGGQSGMMGSQSGMMGGQGGMMGPGMMCPGGMMGGSGAYNPDAKQITIDDAAEMVALYLQAYYGQNLTLAEVMEFTWNFYAEVEEEDTGIHAMELLIDKYTGQVYPEMGPQYDVEHQIWNDG